MKKSRFSIINILIVILSFVFIASVVLCLGNRFGGWFDNSAEDPDTGIEDSSTSIDSSDTEESSSTSDESSSTSSEDSGTEENPDIDTDPDTDTDTDIETVSNYLTFSGDSSTFTTLALSNVEDVGVNIEISDDTKTWETWDGTDYSVTNGVCYVRGYDNTAYSSDDYFCSFSGDFASVDGNIMTLLEYSDPDNSTMGYGAFICLFYGCTSLVSAPELPAATLARECYECMFYGCTSLTEAPELPATTLENACYSEMFYGCTSLVTA
ncbi:MAG: hypothetical protein LUI60_02085, partial [Clostridia bacterium]|nr:hypothetical protein [Clostridia bacterium]